MMKYTTWVWSDKLGDWRKVKSKLPWQKQYRTRYTGRRAAQLQKKRKKQGRIATSRLSSKGKPSRPPKGKRMMSETERKWKLVRTWLSGDLDADLDLMHRLALVARDIRKKLYIAEGQRSVAQQWVYWIAYKAGRGPLAAYPGTSNHTYGNAADVREKEVRGSANIGDIPGARVSMAKHGLCLPVPGEAWHVEIGNNWRA